MALTSTIYAVRVELSHVDRGVYESLDLRLARHPSETAEYLVTRLLAYCLEHEDGIAFGDGISTADEPAVLVRDLTGRITKWIEVGMPSADRLHRGMKLAGRAAVYTHRDARQVLAQLDGQGVHRAAAIPVHAFAPSFIEPLAASLERRSQLTLNVMDGHLYVETAAGSLDAPLAAASFS
jgi:uncharacterized protein YaeQ